MFLFIQVGSLVNQIFEYLSHIVLSLSSFIQLINLSICVSFQAQSIQSTAINIFFIEIIVIK